MHKEKDYIAAHQETMRFLQDKRLQRPPNEMELQRFELEKQLLCAEQSQYIQVKNEERWQRLENTLFPDLCEIAEIQGGRVALDIDEETYHATLTYTGEPLQLDRTACFGLSEFAAIVGDAEDVSIDLSGGFIQLQFSFQLSDPKQIADHSKEIEEIKEKIRCHRIAQALYRELCREERDGPAEK